MGAQRGALFRFMGSFYGFVLWVRFMGLTTCPHGRVRLGLRRSFKWAGLE